MQIHYETPEPIELYVALGSGQLSTATSDTSVTEVEVTGPQAEDFDISQDGRTVRVIAPKHTGFMGSTRGHAVTIRLPHDSDLVTKTGSADLSASGRYDNVRLKTGSGQVEVEVATGATLIESGSGDVRVDEIHGDLRLKSGSGDAEIGELRGTAVLSTGSGDVVIGSSQEATVLKTGSGDLIVKRAGSDVTLTSGSGDLEVGSARRGRVSLKSGSGDLRLGIPAGTPVWTDVNTVSGRVISQLESTGKPAEGQEYVEVRATTVSGDIALTPV
ncbi:MAG: DUF4097 domain-containing protein [Actinomycetota bacterium]|nr:DUF4097 domain-containing protein [Actinomycetota bacterium]